MTKTPQGKLKMKTSKFLIPAVLSLAVLAAAGAVAGLRHASELSSFAQALVSTKVESRSAIIEFVKVPSMETLFALRKQVPQATDLSRFDQFNSDYFRRAYQVTFKGEFASLQTALMKSGVAIKRIELVQMAKLSSLVPSQTKLMGAGQDPLSNYQWALSNDGQKILREIDDIHSETIVADPSGPKIDIGLKDVRARMASAKRDMIVAVVDSGLDTSHEDILKNILVNTAECDGGKIPFKPKEDKDGNGYTGDCMGWNFTTSGDGDNQVDDDLGHGTHVAGIIAAEIGNGIGVSGVAPRIKILPIKVTAQKDAANAMTNRAAKAILYAIKMKADVINFSLGWPISADAEFLRQSFAEARKAGITIVAAAGNNTSAAPVYPCSYEGVICVGAVTISGEVANFSNYGGQVDVMAPGEEILSLFPKGMEPLIFSVKGYEIKNGTSQAAPFVSAQAAILKALVPSITPDEIQARLVSTTKAVKWADKFAMNGVTDVSAALAVSAHPVVRPVFKNIYQVPFTMEDRTFKFALPVKNFWSASNDVKVELSFDSNNLSLDSSFVALGAVATGETKILNISGRIQSTDARREARLFVKITASGRSETFSQQIVLTRQLQNDRDVKTYPITLNSPNAKLNLASIRSVRNNEPYPDYVYADPSDDTGIALKLVRWKNGSFSEEKPVELPGAKAVLFALRVDVNYDGISDYVIASVGQTDDKKWIQFSYLNQNLQPVFGHQQDLRVQVEGAVIDENAMKTLAWIPSETPFGKIAMPLFMTAGGLPKADMNPDPFQFEPNSKRERVYYYEPKQDKGVWTLATRSYDNTKWLNKIRESLSLRFREDLAISTLLPQTPADFATGKVHALVRIGSSTLKTYRMITTEGTAQLGEKAFKLEATQFSGQTFEGAVVASSINLDNAVPVMSAQPALASVYTPTLGRLTSLNGADPSKIDATQSISPARAQDNLLGFIQSYVQGSNLIGFYQTKSQLVMRITGSNTATQSSEPIDRSSLLPGKVFNALFFPITIGQSGKLKRPAIYVDATQLSANRVYLWTVENGQFSAPMNLNVELPSGCKPLAPQRFGTGGEMAYVFMCTSGTGNETSYSLKALAVE
jgi:cell wall-associated protease